MNGGKKVVVVIGMHRSGTSLVAGLLPILGVRLGESLVPARSDNPRGFYEHEGIVALHKRINRLLKRRPMSLTGTLEMPADWLAWPELARYREELGQILVSEVQAAGSSLWGFKDPHTARLLPLWQRLFEEHQLEPVYLLCIRNPSAVAESLKRRDSIPRDHAELLWMQHYLAALKVGSRNIVAFLEYESWFIDFDGQLSRLLAALGMDGGISPETRAKAADFADKGLNHTTRSGSISNPLVAQLYSALRDYCSSRIVGDQLDELATGIARTAESFRIWSEIIDARVKGPQLASETLPFVRTRTGSADMGGRRFTFLAENLDRTQLDGGPPLNICVITYELEGPVRNSGIGSEAADISIGLARLGHRVTVLYVPHKYCENGSFDDWVERYRKAGVELVGLRTPAVPNADDWLLDYKSGSDLLFARAGSYNVCQWLKGKRFDLIHCFDAKGSAYYSLLAKRLRMHFTKCIFHARVYGPEKARKLHNAAPMRDVQELATAYMERRTIEYADIVTAPCESALNDYVKEGYQLSVDRCFVLPSIGCHHYVERPAPSMTVNQIVFLGSLEPRKGLNLFVDGINWLHRNLDEVKEACGGRLPAIHFLGGEHGDFPGVAFLQRQTADWKIPVTWDTENTRRGALTYLSTGDKLVVLPSAENRPSVGLLECIQYGLPFIAARTAANAAVLNAADNCGLLFDLHPARLAEELLNALNGKARYPESAPQTAIDPGSWDMWHRSISHSPGSWRRDFYIAPQSDPEPLVSVCVAHFNRLHFLKQCLDSLEAQTYRNFEVIIVDDGSTDPEAIEFLNQLEPAVRDKGWRIIRQENRYLGAVRNTGAKHARGKYCLFMDDDNYAKPDEIRTFVRIAEQTGAHILTCFADVFRGDAPPDPGKPAIRRITQLGDNVAMGLFRNVYGDSNCFVRRDFFLETGGNTEDYKVGNDDQEFFSRAVLNGARLFLVPEALYWYRENEIRMRMLHYMSYAGNLRVMRPYLEASHPAFRDIFRFAQGQMIAFRKYVGAERWKLKEVLSYLHRMSKRAIGQGGTDITLERAQMSPHPGVLMGAAFHRYLTGERRRRERTLGQFREIFGSLRKLSRKVVGGGGKEITVEQAENSPDPAFLLGLAFRKYLSAEQRRRTRALRRLKAVLNSSSWKTTRPLRRAIRKITSRRDSEFTLQQAEKSPDPAFLLAEIYASFSWQLTWPLRIVSRIFGLGLVKRRIARPRT